MLSRLFVHGGSSQQCCTIPRVETLQYLHPSHLFVSVPCMEIKRAGFNHFVLCHNVT